MNTNYARQEVFNSPMLQDLKNPANDFDSKVNAIWQKVALLKEVKYIENDKETFSVAYRFMEMEFEKICKEKEILQHNLMALLKSAST